MQDNIEQTDNNQTFFRWVYPFDKNSRTKDKQRGNLAEINIPSYYLFSVGNILYHQNIEDIRNKIYKKIDDLGIDRNTIIPHQENFMEYSKGITCPYDYENIFNNLRYYYSEINKVRLSLPLPMWVNWITDDGVHLNGFTLHKKFENKLHNDKHLEYSHLIIFEQSKGLIRACIYETIIDINSIFGEPNIDDYGDFEKGEKEEISYIEFNREFLDNANIDYKTTVRFTGITVDIYPNPTNEQLETMLCNHIYCCVNGEYDHKIKDFLNFHYSNYTGNAIDFIDYVESFVSKNFSPKIAKNVKYYDKTMKWVNSQRTKINQLTNKNNEIPTTSATVEEGKKECKIILQHQEIGLLHYYDELPLNDNNAQRIAEEYGQGSGIVLMKYYRKVSISETQRRNHKNAKKYLETVIPLLTKKEGIEKAKIDLANVKTSNK